MIIVTHVLSAMVGATIGVVAISLVSINRDRMEEQK